MHSTVSCRELVLHREQVCRGVAEVSRSAEARRVDGGREWPNAVRSAPSTPAPEEVLGTSTWQYTIEATQPAQFALAAAAQGGELNRQWLGTNGTYGSRPPSPCALSGTSGQRACIYSARRKTPSITSGLVIPESSPMSGMVLLGSTEARAVGPGNHI